MIELRRQVMLGDDASVESSGCRVVYDPVSNATTTAAALDALDLRSAPRDAHTAALRHYFAVPAGMEAPALNWELTYACTWRCRHCFAPTVHVKAPSRSSAGAESSRRHETVPEETIGSVIDLLRELRAREVSLTGGEVLLVANLPAIVRRLRQALPDLSIRVLLSGQGLARRAVDAGLLQALAATQACARVPLYGPTPEVHDWVTRTPGSFADVLGFAAAARDADARVHLGVQVLAETYPYLAATLRLAEEVSDGDFSLSTIIYPSLHGDGHDHGVSAGRLMYLLRSGSTAAVATEYLSFERGSCGSGCRFPTVDPLGSLRTCDIAGSPVGRLGDSAASLKRGLQPEPQRLAGDCLSCAHADACKRCPAFVGDSGCRPGHRARVAAASLVVGRRVKVARRLGCRLVDGTVDAALGPQTRPPSVEVVNACD